MGVVDTPHLRLHLGCGSSRIPGWVNIDNEADLAPDLVADVRDLPYEDNSVEQIAAFHVLEHFRYDEPVLEEWHRVLVPGGLIVVVVPDLIATYLMRNRLDVGWGPKRDGPLDLQYLNAVVFGGYMLGPPYDRPGQVHHQIFIFDMLRERMAELFPDAREVPSCGIRACELGEYMVMGTKPAADGGANPDN